MTYDLYTWTESDYQILNPESETGITYDIAIERVKESQEMDIENSIGLDGETRQEVIENSSPIVEQAIVPHGYNPNIEGMDGVIDHITDWII